MKLVCGKCWGSLKAVDGVVEEGILERSNLAEIRSGFYYDSAFQKVVHLLKYNRAPIIAKRIADRLGGVVTASVNWKTANWITAIPLHRAKLRERGYNQSAEIGKALSAIVQIPFNAELVVRSVNTVSQTQMSSAADRVTNMQNVFQAKHPELLCDKTVILIDDVITTGATANACAGVLRSAGARTVLMLTAARPVFDATRTEK